MLALAVDGAESHWYGRLGKILLLLAGLIALLDLIGPQRLSRWKRRANRRRAVARRASRHLRRARPLTALARRISNAGATIIWNDHMDERRQRSTGPRRFYTAMIMLSNTGSLITGRSTPIDTWCPPATEQDLRSFARREYVRLKSQRFTGPILDNPQMIAGNVEDGAYRLMKELLIREGRHVDARALTFFLDDFQSKEARHSRIIHALASLGMVASIPTAIVIYEPRVGLLMSIWLSIILCFCFPVMVAVMLMRPAVFVAWNWALASTLYRLASLAGSLIGDERTGRPLRWFALALFFIGSLLDLIVSWNQ